jgi:hypothetical protein
MTIDDVLDGIRDREGTVYAEPPAIDQPTGPYGITLPVLSSARGHACTRDDLRELTVDEARDICRNRMLAEIRQHGFDRIGDDNLRAQMLDYAWNSGTLARGALAAANRRPYVGVRDRRDRRSHARGAGALAGAAREQRDGRAAGARGVSRWHGSEVRRRRGPARDRVRQYAALG